MYKMQTNCSHRTPCSTRDLITVNGKWKYTIWMNDKREPNGNSSYPLGNVVTCSIGLLYLRVRNVRINLPPIRGIPIHLLYLNTLLQSIYCKRGYFRWGKISRKRWQDISRGGYFHDTTPISFIKEYGFYFRVGIIFAKKTTTRKTRKLTPRENFHVYSTSYMKYPHKSVVSIQAIGVIFLPTRRLYSYSVSRSVCLLYEAYLLVCSSCFIYIGYTGQFFLIHVCS